MRQSETVSFNTQLRAQSMIASMYIYIYFWSGHRQRKIDFHTSFALTGSQDPGTAAEEDRIAARRGKDAGSGRGSVDRCSRRLAEIVR